MEQPDISKVLAYEIKKELADRYFGYRKLIEEDKEELEKKIKHFTQVMVQDICFGLVRVYILLKDEKLIREFLNLIGLEEDIFYDPYLTESPTIRARVFEGIKMRGFTKSGRFKNLVFDCYNKVVKKVEEYREVYGELLDSREIIIETIKIFQRENDITNIMGFFRSLDSKDMKVDLGGRPDPGFVGHLEEKMKVEPPQPIEQSIPYIPPLVPISGIKRRFKKIVEQAYAAHDYKFTL